MKILLGYSYYPYPHDMSDIVNAWVNRLNKSGFQIDTIPLTLNPPNNPIWWPVLNEKWKLGDKQLLQFYDNLLRKLENYDVFLNLNGINIHPEILKYFPTFNVYGCNDDPDSSERLSRPVAKYYDLCLIGNIAEIETYKSWGVKEVRFWPMGFMATDFEPEMKEEDINNKERDIDIALLCEKKYVIDRNKRLDAYSKAFPSGMYYGDGWEKGFYPVEKDVSLYHAKKVSLYQRTKIGPNFHNSTGPINFRTYTLPANGVMQICDNKKNLGKIFELNKEVIGFDNVKEAIDLTRYYLSHDNERIEIAIAGWKRTIKDYNEINNFQKAVDYINFVIKKNNLKDKKYNYERVNLYLKKHKRNIFLKKLFYIFKNYFISLKITLNEYFKMKFLILIDQLSVGGAEKQAILFADYLQNKKNQIVEIWSFLPGNGTAKDLCDKYSLKIKVIGYFRGLAHYLYPFQIIHYKKVFGSYKPDVVMGYTNMPNLLLGFIWKKIGAKYFVWGQQGIEPTEYKFNSTELKAIKLTPCFISNSVNGAEYLKNDLKVPDEKVHIIFNGPEKMLPGFSPTEWYEKLGISENDFIAIMVANITRYKDHQTLIHSWKYVVERYNGMGRPILLLIGGFGETITEVFRLVLDLNLFPYIKFLGNHVDIKGLNNIAGISILSSNGEGLPNVLLEAMDDELPIVGTDIPGIREAVGEENYQYLAPSKNPEILAEKILLFANNDELRKKVGINNKQRVEKLFRLGEMCEKTYNLIIHGIEKNN
ncbi:MAG: glycosyltransferase [Bacteroidia bacterium]|nr:glycosyltransferase [Bacteroidia bacterium]